MSTTYNFADTFGFTDTALNQYFGVGAEDAVFYFGDDNVETYLEDELALYGADFELTFSNREQLQYALDTHLVEDYYLGQGYVSESEYQQNTVFQLLAYVDFDVVSDQDYIAFQRGFAESFD